ncbi:MAG: hypothetical protein ACRDJU_00250, partial [Actinomycetota bacterium]
MTHHPLTPPCDRPDPQPRRPAPARAFDPERIRSLVNRIVASGQFSRDTPLGRILHPRERIAFRRRSGRDSVHIG